MRNDGIDKQKIIAAIFEKTGIRISVDDPVWLLVELNDLYLKESTSSLRHQMETSSLMLSHNREKHFEDIVTVANEILSRYTQQHNELKKTLADIKKIEINNRSTQAVSGKRPSMTTIHIYGILNTTLLLILISIVLITK